MLNHILTLRPLLIYALMTGHLISCQTSGTHTEQSPSDIYYEGRIDHNSSESPTIIWQGSEIVLEYRGTVQSVHFEDLSNSSYFDVYQDGDRLGMIAAREGAVSLPPSRESGDDGWHTLTLVKRSEASAGHVRLSHFTVEGDTRPHTPPAPSRKFLFFGDSITAGACSEDGAQDQWDDRSTHNALKSYAALTANHFAADYQNISISGVGISAGYQPYTVPEVWDRLYPNPESAPANLQQFQPDVIFVNYGENDDSFTTNQGQPFPADYTQRYLGVLDNLRQAYPDSAIVILRGGMWGGANSPRLREPWEQVAEQFTQRDPHSYSYVFNHWSEQHPRTDDHEIMADELVTWLNRQPWFTVR